MAAKLAGAAPEIVERIHEKSLNCLNSPMSIDDILTGKSKYDNYNYVYQSLPYSPIDIKHPENAEQYLEHLADLMMQHNVLQTRPVFRIMEQDSHRHRVADQNDNWFEIAWLYGQKEEILKDFAIHRILREEKVPHLITAEFGFENENVSWLVFRYYHRGLSLYNAYPAKMHMLQLKDVLKAVRQLYQLFSRYIVPIDQICAARPLSVKTRMFDSQDLWLIPDGKGSYDFKFIVNYSYSVMKLTHDGAGILIYENDSFSEAHFPVFTTLGLVAEDLGYEELGRLILDDPYQADFEEIYNVINRCGSIST